MQNERDFFGKTRQRHITQSHTHKQSYSHGRCIIWHWQMKTEQYENDLKLKRISHQMGSTLLADKEGPIFLLFHLLLLWYDVRAQFMYSVILAIATKQNKTKTTATAAAAFLFIKPNEMLTSSIPFLIHFTFLFFRSVNLAFVSDFTICVYSVCIFDSILVAAYKMSINKSPWTSLLPLVYYLWSV